MFRDKKTGTTDTRGNREEKVKVKVREKVNFTLEQATKAQGGSRCTPLLFL